MGLISKNQGNTTIMVTRKGVQAKRCVKDLMMFGQKSLQVKMNLWGGDIHDFNGMEFGNDVGVTFLQEISHALRPDNHWRD